MRKEIEEALLERCGPREGWGDVLDVVWETLEDKIGAAQEKLLNDLSYARHERDSARRKVEVLADDIRNLRSQLEASSG